MIHFRKGNEGSLARGSVCSLSFVFMWKSKFLVTIDISIPMYFVTMEKFVLPKIWPVGLYPLCSLV